MPYDEFTCEACVRFRGENLSLNRIILYIDLDEIRPPRGPVDPMDHVRARDAQEKRQRFVDMVAAIFADSLTKVLLKND